MEHLILDSDDLEHGRDQLGVLEASWFISDPDMVLQKSQELLELVCQSETLLGLALMFPEVLQVLEGGGGSDSSDLGQKRLAPLGSKDCVSVVQELGKLLVEVHEGGVVNRDLVVASWPDVVLQSSKSIAQIVELGLSSYEQNLSFLVDRAWIVFLEPCHEIAHLWRSHQLLNTILKLKLDFSRNFV